MSVLCFYLTDALPPVKPVRPRSRVVWTQHGHNPEGWYTVCGDSYIFYGNDKRRAQYQSNLTNEFNARPECPNPYCDMKKGHIYPCTLRGKRVAGFPSYSGKHST